MASNHKQTCSICGEDLILETTNIPDEWPRELSYTCPNGHGRHLVVELKDPESKAPRRGSHQNLPTKYIYTLPRRQEQDFELYCAAHTIRSKIASSTAEAQNWLKALEDYINGTIIQYHRIREDNKLMIEAFKDLSKCAPSLSKSSMMDPTDLMLLIDTHFFLICLDKINNLYPKLLRHIASLGKGAQDNTERRKKRRLVQNKFKQALSGVTHARHFMEHIEERIGKGECGTYTHIWDGTNIDFVYGHSGQQYRLRIDIKPVTDAYKAFIGMLRSLPDLD